MGSVKTKYLWAGIVFVMISGGLIFAGLMAVLIQQDREAARYPGSEQLAGHNLFKVIPNFIYRQDASFRTEDDFTRVYNWYSRGFNLGPEKNAQSNCSHMYNSELAFFLERIVTVTICDTTSGRMIFIQRTIELDF